MNVTALYVQLASEILLLRRVFPPLQQHGASKWDTRDISAEATVKFLFEIFNMVKGCCFLYTPMRIFYYTPIGIICKVFSY